MTDTIFLRAYGIDEVVMDTRYTKQPSQQSGAYSMQTNEDLRDHYFQTDTQ